MDTKELFDKLLESIKATNPYPNHVFFVNETEEWIIKQFHPGIECVKLPKSFVSNGTVFVIEKDALNPRLEYTFEEVKEK